MSTGPRIFHVHPLSMSLATGLQFFDNYSRSGAIGTNCFYPLRMGIDENEYHFLLEMDQHSPDVTAPRVS